MVVVARIVVALVLIARGCATSSESQYQPSTETVLDIYSAVLRARLARVPLARHGDLHVFMNLGVTPGLPERLREYRVVVHRGDRGPSPKYRRWYWLHLGRVTADEAFVWIEAPEPPRGRIVQLR